MLHRGEYLAERVEILGHGGYLPVEVPACDNYGKRSQWHIGLGGIDLHVNSLTVKVKICTVEPEAFYSSHELQELWNGKCKLLEKTNLEILEARRGDPTKNCF